MKNQSEEIAKWYRVKAEEQSAVRWEQAEHAAWHRVTVVSTYECRQCRELKRRFDASSMGD